MFDERLEREGMEGREGRERRERGSIFLSCFVVAVFFLSLKRVEVVLK